MRIVDKLIIPMANDGRPEQSSLIPGYILTLCAYYNYNICIEKVAYLTNNNKHYLDEPFFVYLSKIARQS